MTELKTLKDCKDKEEAREQAVKWIKSKNRVIKRCVIPSKLHYDSPLYPNVPTSDEYQSITINLDENVRKAFCLFFNITEEDLK